MKPELLDGENMYACEICDKKCKALKGIKIERIPEVLSVIINRFDFDYVKL